MAGDRLANRTTYDSFNRSAAAAGRRTSTLRESEGGFMPAQGPDGKATEDASAFLAREGGDADSSSSCLSCFVEVHFRGKRQRTSAVDSNAPIWNEQVGWTCCANCSSNPAGTCECTHIKFWQM
jgi:hypothetical protein